MKQSPMKTMDIRNNCALLARANHQLTQGFFLSRGKSALFQEKDCFECLSPHETAA